MSSYDSKFTPYGMPSGEAKGTALPNLFININDKTASSLTGSGVDAKLSKTDQLLAFNERIERDVNPAVINNMFAAGELMAGHVDFRILRTKVTTYLEQQMAKGQNIPKITIYRADIINGKMQITDEFIYEKCIITEYKSSMGEHTTQDDYRNLDSANYSFRFLTRTHNVVVYDQTGNKTGNDSSVIDFRKGQLGS